MAGTATETRKLTPAKYIELAIAETDLAVKIGYLRAARRGYGPKDSKLIDYVSKRILEAASLETDPEKKIGYLRGERGFYITRSEKERAREVTKLIQEMEKQEKTKDAGWNVGKYTKLMEAGDPTAIGYLRKAAAAYNAAGKIEMAQEILRQLPAVREEAGRIRRKLEKSKGKK